jgi:hypothetical protein
LPRLVGSEACYLVDWVGLHYVDAGLTGTASEGSLELGCKCTMLFYAEMKTKRRCVDKELCSCSLGFFVRGFVYEALCLLMLYTFKSRFCFAVSTPLSLFYLIEFSSQSFRLSISISLVLHLIIFKFILQSVIPVSQLDRYIYHSL